MQFAAPLFLWGLLAVSIPVLIHLFDFRRFKRLYFSDTWLLREMLEKTRKQSKLRHLIILLLRILAIAALVMAFSQPYLPGKDQQQTSGGQKSICVYIDNSFSMEAVGESNILFETAREKAREIAMAYQESDRFQLLTNDFEGKHQRWVNRDEFIEMLEMIKTSPFNKDINSILDRQADLITSTPGINPTIYLISDFQTNTTGIQSIRTPEYPVNLVPVNTPTDNLSIDSLWFDSPLKQQGQLMHMGVSIRNYSDDVVENITVRLYLDGREKGVSETQISPNGRSECQLSFMVSAAGSHAGYVEIEDSPLTFDDRMYFAFDIAEEIPVLDIKGTGSTPYIRTLFANDSLIRYSEVPEGNINTGDFYAYSLIVTDEVNSISSGAASELARFVREGGSLLIIPPLSYKSENYNALFGELGIDGLGYADTSKTRISSIEYAHPLYRDIFESTPKQIDLPNVNYSYSINANSGISLLRLLNGKSFMTQYSCGKGKVYLMASPLQPSASPFASHAMFVPTIFQIALLSFAEYRAYHIFGNTESIEVRKDMLKSGGILRIVNKDESIEIIPGGSEDSNGKIFIQQQLSEAGPYYLKNQAGNTQSLAFNYNRTESNPLITNNEELKQLILNHSNIALLENTGPLTEMIRRLEFGTMLWKTFVWLALIFLAAEVILLRIWNRKS